MIEGSLRFRIGDDEELIASAGESVPLAANVPHGVDALEDSVVLDVFSPVREDWLRGEDAYLRGARSASTLAVCVRRGYAGAADLGRGVALVPRAVDGADDVERRDAGRCGAGR